MAEGSEARSDIIARATSEIQAATAASQSVYKYFLMMLTCFCDCILLFEQIGAPSDPFTSSRFATHYYSQNSSGRATGFAGSLVRNGSPTRRVGTPGFARSTLGNAGDPRSYPLRAGTAGDYDVLREMPSSASSAGSSPALVAMSPSATIPTRRFSRVRTGRRRTWFFAMFAATSSTRSSSKQ
jgi:hypothetical protein